MRKILQALVLAALVWPDAGSTAKAADTYVVWDVNSAFADTSQFLYGTLTYASGDTNDFVDWNLHTLNANYVSNPAFPHTQATDDFGAFVSDDASSVYIGSNDGSAILSLNFLLGLDSRNTPSFGMITTGDLVSYESVTTDELGVLVITSYSVANGVAALDVSEPVANGLDVPEPASLTLLGTGILLLGSRLRRRSGD